MCWEGQKIKKKEDIKTVEIKKVEIISTFFLAFGWRLVFPLSAVLSLPLLK